jgi:trigger factor
VVIERPVADVGPEDVEQTIAYCASRGLLINRFRAAAATGDRATVDFTGRIEASSFPAGQAKDFAIVLGEARMLPEFETAVTGMKAGDTKSFSLVFPADYHGNGSRGQGGGIRVDGEIGRGTESCRRSTAEFAKAFGIASGSLRSFETEIEANLRLN